MGKYDALFENDTAPAAAAPSSKYAALFDNSSPAEEPIANAGNTTPEVSTRPPESGLKKAGRILFPAMNEYVDKAGTTDPSVGKYGALANDILSAPRRAFGAGYELLHGNTQGAEQEMEATKGKGILGAITREAPLFLMPSLGAARAANVAGRIGSAVGAGAAESIPLAAVHQAENKAAGKDYSPGQALGEVASGGLLRGGFQAGSELLHSAVPMIKRGISKLTEIPKEALDAVTGPGGQTNLANYADAAKKFGTEEGSNVMPLAEEVGQKVNTENAARIAAVDAARTAQQDELQNTMVGLRNSVTGKKAARIGDISSHEAGQDIKNTIEASKQPMQDVYQAGDKAAYGELRGAPVATKKASRIEIINERVPGPDGSDYILPHKQTITEKVPVLPGMIDEVLTEFKALNSDQGVSKISEEGAGAIKWIKEKAGQAKTIDDLVNLKGHVRQMQAAGGFRGALFDATRDDLALAKVMDKIHETEALSIRQAAPKRASQIIPMVEANNQLYGRTLTALKAGDMKFRNVQSSENIISKVKAMGPEQASALMAEAQTNKVLKPYVDELRNGFVDDLLLSSVKDGEFQGANLSKNWKNISNDVKQAWLTPQIIKQVDDAVDKGTKEIADPQLVGTALFGKNFDINAPGYAANAEHKLSNIASAQQKKALADLQALDHLFGSDYTQQAISAYRAKQLQLGTTGELAKMGNIRTGKALGAASVMGSAGAGAGAAIGGPIGAAVGGPAGAGLGFYLQSPAGAVMIFNALNRLEKAGGPGFQKFLSQSVRSGAFGENQQ